MNSNSKLVSGVTLLGVVIGVVTGSITAGLLNARPEPASEVSYTSATPTESAEWCKETGAYFYAWLPKGSDDFQWVCTHSAEDIETIKQEVADDWALDSEGRDR